MRAGKLRDSVTFEARTETRDAQGAPTQTWATFATTRCEVRHLTGKEYFAADHERTDATVMLRIRYLSGLTTKHRAVINSVNYDIEAVLPLNNNREMHVILRYES